MLYFFAIVPLMIAIYWIFRGESKRKEAVRMKETAFLAAVRADPHATTTPLVGKVGPVRPNAADLLSADAITTGMARPAVPMPASEPGSPPTATSPSIARPIGMPAGIAPAADNDAHCALCAQLVDVKSSDPTLWGVKIPDEASARFRWYHFNCATHALHRATLLETALQRLIVAHTPEGTDTLAAALAQAQQLIGPTRH